ncbi:MAG: site-2 protease family protein [bacterium]|nr:site-2 protease family protein [bacterium]
MHEIAHVLIANRLGYEHENIIIRAYDAWAEIYLDNTPSRHQILIFVAGPIMNLILAIIAIAISYMLDIDLFKIITLRTAYLPLIISNLFWINFLLAISNMLPAYPLDGGRILENILSYFTPAPGATYIAIYISLATGGFIMAIGYYISLYMIALFGAYIIFSAHQSLKAIND